MELWNDKVSCLSVFTEDPCRLIYVWHRCNFEYEIESRTLCVHFPLDLTSCFRKTRMSIPLFRWNNSVENAQRSTPICLGSSSLLHLQWTGYTMCCEARQTDTRRRKPHRHGRVVQWGPRFDECGGQYFCRAASWESSQGDDLEAVDDYRLDSFFDKYLDGRVSEGIIPPGFKPSLPMHDQYVLSEWCLSFFSCSIVMLIRYFFLPCLAVAILDIDERPVALLCAYNTHDHVNRFVR